jgi:AcrR family transcriptional regulator
MELKSTKTRIMDAAEKLFAENSFHATSLRDITKAAHVNLAAVNYHFGSKEDLLDAILTRRIAPVNAERLAMLSKTETLTGGKAPDVRATLRAYLLPPFRKAAAFGNRHTGFLRLLGRMHAETHSDLRNRFLQHFTPVIERFSEAFTRALPELSVDEVQSRMQFVIGAMAHTLLWGEHFAHPHPHDESQFEHLIDFCEAGMRAPSMRLQWIGMGA